MVGGYNAINATLYQKLNFNFIHDIAPVASLTRSSIVMVVNPSVAAKTVPEFIAYGRRRYGPCALSWWRAGPHRSHLRSGAGHVRHHCLTNRIYQGW